MSLGQALSSRKEFKPPALQITSMMDMFTIIVFFLLFSYSEKPDEFDLTEGLELPASNVEIDYKNSVSLFIAIDDIRIDGDVISTITNKTVDKLDPNALEKSALFKKLTDLKAEKDAEEKLVKVDKDNPTKDKPLQVLVFCDKRIPFKTLNLIIKTAGLVGFSNFQLAVTEVG